MLLTHPGTTVGVQTSELTKTFDTRFTLKMGHFFCRSHASFSHRQRAQKATVLSKASSNPPCLKHLHARRI